MERCDALSVIVFSRDAEPIPGELRAEWVRAECPGVRVVHVVANYPDPWDEESWGWWVQACRRCAPGASHLVSAEAYGDELARRMGLEHLRADRTAEPAVSGTEVRTDPLRHWRHVPAAVRPWLATKVAIVGAESTGKSTLAADLARMYGTVWTPEYGREYCEMKDTDTLGPTDLLAIAAGQARLEDEAAVRCGGLLFCDTDVMVTRAWSRHLCGMVHPGILEVERTRRYALHLVTAIGVPWQNDGTRVCGEPGVREWFHRQFVEELAHRGVPHMQLPARRGDALAAASNVIETIWPGAAALRAAVSAGARPGPDLPADPSA